jgi:glycosyltransferase involved in cell wall biosynthesis
VQGIRKLNNYSAGKGSLVDGLVRVSVVVSTYTPERLESVSACFQSLKRQTLLPYEIILVLDPDEALVAYYRSKVPPDVRIVVSNARGLSCARNAGIQHARGEILAFIDDDAEADEHWLARLVRHYRDPAVVGVGGSAKARWNGRRPRWFPEELDWVVGCSYKGLPEGVSEVRNPIGCSMSFRKSVFGEVGVFDSVVGRVGKQLLGSEETEFCIRVHSCLPEAKIVYDPSAVVYHRVDRQRQTLRYVLTRSFYEGVSKALVSCAQTSSSPLSTESYYLKYLLTVAVPARLKRLYRLESLAQLVTLLLSTGSVLVGYVKRG